MRTGTARRKASCACVVLVSTHIRAPHIPTAVTIGGRRLFHSELLIMWLLLEGGDYSRAASNRRSTVHTYGPFVDSMILEGPK